MKLSAAVAVAAMGIALSGCATIIDGSSEKIGITTGDVTGARCTLSNGRGQWSVVTPGKVNVARSKHDMKVVCSKPGLPDATATIPSDLNGWALVNFAIIDLPGLGVDAATGAINDYNDTTHIRMGQSYGNGAYGAQSYGVQPQQPSYPSYPAQTQAPPRASQTPPAYIDNSQQYQQPAQSYDDQSQSYPDQSQTYPDQSQTYPDQSQTYQDQSQPYPQQPSYPDNSQSAPGTLPPL